MQNLLKVKGLAETNASNPFVVVHVKGDEDFVERMSNEVIKKKLGPAFLSFEVENDRLCSVVLYPIKEGENLTQEEIAEIATHTSIEFSDGIGDNFSLKTCAIENGYDIYVSPWCFEQKLTAELKTVYEWSFDGNSVIRE